MIRTFALITVFAVSLFAVPTQSTTKTTTPTTNIIPTPTCDPNCPACPWCRS